MPGILRLRKWPAAWLMLGVWLLQALTLPVGRDQRARLENYLN
jgi:hypothetical protein